MKRCFCAAPLSEPTPGAPWTDSTLNNRYLYIDPTRVSVRNCVFGLSLPSESAIEALSAQGLWNMESHDVNVTMLNSGTSTLFISERMQDFEAALDLVAYYNNTGELFITRGVQNGDSYRFTAQLPTGSESQVDSHVGLLRNPGRRSIRERAGKLYESAPGD